MQDQLLLFVPAQWGRSGRSPVLPCRKSQMLCSGKEMKEAGMAETAEVGRASRSIMSEAPRWTDRGLGWEKDFVFKELARKLGDRLETQANGGAGEHRLPGTLGEGVEGCMSHIPSGMSDRASPTADLPAWVCTTHSWPLVLGKERSGIPRTFQRNLTVASIQH